MPRKGLIIIVGSCALMLVDVTRADVALRYCKKFSITDYQLRAIVGAAAVKICLVLNETVEGTFFCRILI